MLNSILKAPINFVDSCVVNTSYVVEKTTQFIDKSRYLQIAAGIYFGTDDYISFGNRQAPVFRHVISPQTADSDALIKIQGCVALALMTVTPILTHKICDKVSNLNFFCTVKYLMKISIPLKNFVDGIS